MAHKVLSNLIKMGRVVRRQEQAWKTDLSLSLELLFIE